MDVGVGIYVGVEGGNEVDVGVRGSRVEVDVGVGGFSVGVSVGVG